MKYKFTLPFILFFLLLTAFMVKLSLNQRGDLFSKTQMIGIAVPNLLLPTLSGGSMKSSDLHGKMALVNFFASWCVACRYEQPALSSLAKKTGVSIYGIAWKDNDEKTDAWLKKFGNPYKKIGIDHDGKAAIAFGITGVPETFLIDKNAKILFRQPGPIDERTYNDLLKILKK